MKCALKYILILIFLVELPASAAIVGPKENRMTYQEYAAKKYGGDRKALFDDLGAAGHFHCVGYASASLVKKPDVLVMAAHELYAKNRAGQCVRRGNLSNCFFETINPDGTDGQKVTIQPDTIRISQNYSCDATEIQNDWAIVRLTAPVASIKPFGIVYVQDYGSSQTGYRRLEGSKVTSLAADNNNFRNLPDETPTICDDTLGYVWLMPGKHPGYGIGVGCSSGLGTSGGAILVNSSNGERLFVGLTSFSMIKSFDREPLSENNFTGGLC